MMKSKLTLGLVGLVGLSGCMDLEEEVVSGVTSSYYETAAGLEDAVDASYASLKDLFGNERSMTLTELGTDLFTKGADGGFKYFNDYTSRLDAYNRMSRDEWDAMYRAINTVNAVIDRAAKIDKGISEQQKNARIAEVRFLRGVYYFDLVRHFGAVPLSLKETTGVITEATRAPEPDVYKQIIDDLNFALSNLPVKQGQYGRATKGAAQHMLGLVHLTRSYKPFAEANDAAKAADLFKQVIDSKQYSLLPKYSSLWDINNERHKEVIFSVQNSHDPLTVGSGNSWHLYFLMEYDREPGMHRVVHYGRPFKRLRPTEHLLNLWDREMDVRYEESFQFVWFATKNDPKRGLSVGDTTIFIPGVKTSQLPAKYQGKNYRIFTEPENFWSPKPTKFGAEYDYRYFPALLKHQDPTRFAVNDTRGQRDFVVARLGDTYLLLAEALFKQGKLAEAAEAINKVRVRAAKPGMAEEMKITPADVTLDFILDERGRELAGEGHRWFTLQRTGKLVERVKQHNKDGAGIQPHHVLRPIPQTQIDRVTNEFAQNPGY